MFHLEKWIDFNVLGKVVILLVADAGAGGSLGSSSPAYPGLESRLSNARRSCFVVFFLFMRLDSMCYYARQVVTACGREAVPAVGTSRWAQAPSLAAQRHFWSPGFEFLLFTQLPP